MIKKVFIVLLVLLLSILYFSHWLGCHLDSKFLFSALDLKLRIIFDIRSDGATIPFVARLFHNKATQGGADIFNGYIHFWDIRFLLYLLSPLTIFGAIVWAFYVVRRDIKISLLQKCLIFLFLVAPIFLEFHVIKNQSVGLILFSLPITLFSVKGLLHFSKKQKYYWAYMLLGTGVSLWYLFVIPVVIAAFCHG